jgi:hypothetical protein
MILKIALLAAVLVVSLPWTFYLSVTRIRKERFFPEVTWFEWRRFILGGWVIDRNGLDVKKLIGLDLTDNEIAELSGAPAGSTITLHWKTLADWHAEGTGADQPPEGLYFYVKHRWIATDANIVGLTTEVNHMGTEIHLYLKDIMFGENAPAGLAARMLARMVRTGESLGVSKMRLLAAGGRLWPGYVLDGQARRWGGYYAWPKYGFDMGLDVATKALYGAEFPLYPENLAGCYNILDVLARKSGSTFWQVVGNGWFMSFTLTNPTQRDKLASALKEKGV